MTLGGRYLEYVLKSDFMGMPFEGKGTMAFDKTEKKFKSTWRDNMSTGITYMEGTYDKNNSTLTTIGTSMDPMTMQEIQTKEATKFVSKDKYVMEMYMTMDGKEIKTMEVTYTRK